MKTLYRDRGMTLIELLVVIAIIGIIAGVTLPAFHIMSRGYRLKTATKLVTDTLNSARTLAITFRKSYYVELDDENGNNRIGIFFLDRKFANGDPDNPSHRRYVGEWKHLTEPIVFIDSDVIINPDLRYRKPPDYVKFKPNGGASGGSMGITIIDPTTYEGNPPFDDKDLLEKAKTCHITVINVTGRVRSKIE